MKKHLFVIPLLVIAIFVLPGRSVTASMLVQSQEMDSADVLQAAYDAVAEKEIDAAMSYVADEIVSTEDHITIRGGAILTPEGAEKPHRVDTWLISMHVRDGKIAHRRIAFMPAADDATTVTDASEIEGVWHVLGVDFDFYHKFYADGTFHAAFSPDALDDEPQAVGEYWIDDGQFHMTELEVVDIPPCGDQPAIYEAQLLASGNLQLTLFEDACGPRANATNRIHE